MLRATVKYRAEKTHIRELRGHRQSTKHKGARDCVASPRAFAGLSQPSPLQEGSLRTRMEPEAHAPRWERALSHWHKERCRQRRQHLCPSRSHPRVFRETDWCGHQPGVSGHPSHRAFHFPRDEPHVCGFYVSFTDSLFASQKYGLFSSNTKGKFF